MATRRDKATAALVQEHRLRLVRVAEKRGVDRVRELYQEGAADVGRKLAKVVRAGRGKSYTAYAHRQVLAQLKDGIGQLAVDMTDELSDASEDAQVEGISGLAEDLRKLAPKFAGVKIAVPVDEAVTLRSLVGARRAQLDRMHQKSMASWGARAFDAVHKELSLSLATGETTDQAIDRITEADTGLPDLEWYQAERIVRTESSFAFNSAHIDGIKEAMVEVPEMRARWVEYVDDETGEPLDDRVAVDSLAMMGQVVLPGRLFVMPDSSPEGEPVPEGLIGQAWAFPPNRPNDRATVMPFFPGMDVIAWEFRGGRRIDLT